MGVNFVSDSPRQRAPGGGRKPLDATEESVKLEIVLPANLKAALQFEAASRKTTVSRLIRGAIPWILNGSLTRRDPLDLTAGQESDVDPGDTAPGSLV